MKTASNAHNCNHTSASTVLYEVVIDWLYYLTTAFAICLVLWLVYFVTFELDSAGILPQSIAFVDSHFW